MGAWVQSLVRELRSHKPQGHNQKNKKRVIRLQENKRKREFFFKKSYKNKSKAYNKMATRTNISIITLNVNIVNAPTRRQRLAEWIQKQDLYICCLQETHFRSKDTNKVKGYKKVCHANGNENWSSNTHTRQNRL